MFFVRQKVDAIIKLMNLLLQGELCVKTCQLMIGYRGKEEKFFDSDGFFHTGDLGYYDKEGAIHFMEEVYL